MFRFTADLPLHLLSTDQLTELVSGTRQELDLRQSGVNRHQYPPSPVNPIPTLGSSGTGSVFDTQVHFVPNSPGIQLQIGPIPPPSYDIPWPNSTGLITVNPAGPPFNLARSLNPIRHRASITGLPTGLHTSLIHQGLGLTAFDGDGLLKNSPVTRGPYYLQSEFNFAPSPPLNETFLLKDSDLRQEFLDLVISLQATHLAQSPALSSSALVNFTNNSSDFSPIVSFSSSAPPQLAPVTGHVDSLDSNLSGVNLWLDRKYDNFGPGLDRLFLFRPDRDALCFRHDVLFIINGAFQRTPIVLTHSPIYQEIKRLAFIMHPEMFYLGPERSISGSRLFSVCCEKAIKVPQEDFTHRILYDWDLDPSRAHPFTQAVYFPGVFEGTYTDLIFIGRSVALVGFFTQQAINHYLSLVDYFYEPPSLLNHHPMKGKNPFYTDTCSFWVLSSKETNTQCIFTGCSIPFPQHNFYQWGRQVEIGPWDDLVTHHNMPKNLAPRFYITQSLGHNFVLSDDPIILIPNDRSGFPSETLFRVLWE